MMTKCLPPRHDLGLLNVIFVRKQIFDRLFFVSKYQKAGKFAVSIERLKAKSVSVLEGLRPLAPDQGSLPLDPAIRF